MTISKSSLSSAQVQQQMNLNLSELVSYILILVSWNLLEGILVSVRSLRQLTFPEEHVAIL